MVLEGADQYRGCFSRPCLTAVAIKGAAPLKNRPTHGWTVDGDGKAMHKSRATALYPEDIIPKFGADLLRLWASSSDYRVRYALLRSYLQAAQRYLFEDKTPPDSFWASRRF
jgi:isoleucyl-tRNA synthetase